MPCVLLFCSDVEDDPCHGAGGMQSIGFSALRESERTGLPSDPNAPQQLASGPSPVPSVDVRAAQGNATKAGCSCACADRSTSQDRGDGNGQPLHHTGPSRWRQIEANQECFRLCRFCSLRIKQRTHQTHG
jgi:hypothetical protein